MQINPKFIIEPNRLCRSSNLTQVYLSAHPYHLTFVEFPEKQDFGILWDVEPDNTCTSHWLVQFYQNLPSLHQCWRNLRIGCKKQRHWSACTSVQADLCLCCLHILRYFFLVCGSLGFFDLFFSLTKLIIIGLQRIMVICSEIASGRYFNREVFIWLSYLRLPEISADLVEVVDRI